MWFHRLLRPRKAELILFSFVITPIILWELYVLSFNWFLEINYYLTSYFILGSLGLLGIFLTDQRFTTQLSKYVLLATLLLGGYALLAYPVRDWLLNQSEQQVKEIGAKVERYKKIYGSYPATLDLPFFNTLPTHSCMGTEFVYKKCFNSTKQEECYIYYASFKGSSCSYNPAERTLACSD